MRRKGAVEERGYAVLWCRNFRLQAIYSTPWRRRRGHLEAAPLALVDETQRQSIILCSNALAEKCGVLTGMPTVQALARCPDLQVERPSETSELATSGILLEAALSWVPGVEESAPGIFTLDLASQPRALWLESAYDLQGELAQEGLEVVIGLGETPDLARLAAQAAYYEGRTVYELLTKNRLARLDHLPLLVAELGAELRAKLQLWGITHLGAFARLQREEIAARLGEEGVVLWLRLTGRLHRPLRYAKLEESYERQYEFDYEVTERETLLVLLRRFVEQLAARVGKTGRAVTALHLLLTFTEGASHAKRLALPEASLDAEHFFRLLSTHLENIEMKAAVMALSLRVEVSDLVAAQGRLFGVGLRNRHQYEETLTRLRNIVGDEQIGSPRRLDSHRPGIFERVPLSVNLSENTAMESGPPWVGPTFRKYRHHFRTRVQLREGRPWRVETPHFSGMVVAACGPWRCGGDWWHRGREWERLEWDVELQNLGLFRLVEMESHWVLEGYYD